MNFNRLFLCVVVTLTVNSIPANGMSSGSELYSMCKTVFIPKSELTKPSNIVALSKCMGYVRGFAEASSLYEMLLTTSESQNYSAGDFSPFACGLANISSEDLAKDIVRFIDNKPSAIEEHPTLITMSAFGKKYPCGK